MRYSAVLLTLLVCLGTNQAWSRDQPGADTQRAAVFAYPGKECPVRSHMYKGPEADEIKQQGGVYCVFDRKYSPVERDTYSGKCPDGSSPDTTASADRSARFIWCDSQKITTVTQTKSEKALTRKTKVQDMPDPSKAPDAKIDPGPAGAGKHE